MDDRIEITEKEFKRLQLLFDVTGVMYSTGLLHTEEFPTFVVFDEDMRSILCSTKREGNIVFYLMPQGYSHLKLLNEPFVGIDGILQEFTKNKISKST